MHPTHETMTMARYRKAARITLLLGLQTRKGKERPLARYRSQQSIALSKL